MAVTDVDKVNGFTIRKLHSADKSKSFGYISGTKDEHGNLTEVVEHGSLTEARTFRGFVHGDVPKTLPRSTYKQNQKGYDPHSTK